MVKSVPMNVLTIRIRRQIQRNHCPKANASITFYFEAVWIPRWRCWTTHCRCPNSYRITNSAFRIMRAFIPNCSSPIASNQMLPMPHARFQRKMTLTTRPRCAKESTLVRISSRVFDRINVFIPSWRSPCSSFCSTWLTSLRRTDGECCICLWRCCSVPSHCSSCSWPRCGIPSNGMAFYRANWPWKSHWIWSMWSGKITDSPAFEWAAGSTVAEVCWSQKSIWKLDKWTMSRYCSFRFWYLLKYYYSFMSISIYFTIIFLTITRHRKGYINL